MKWYWLYQWGTPKAFYTLSQRLGPWLCLLAFIGFAYGCMGGLFLAPMDYQQKDAFRIIYIHVPCALVSLSVYVMIGLLSIVYLVWRVKVADVVATVSAPYGAALTVLALITGAFWGKPMWGTWWVWDARLTSELILLFLYGGYIGLRCAVPDITIAATCGSVLAVVGLLDIPVIHYSVDWWNTLHQGATISKFAKPSMAAAMLYPLISMIIGLYCFYGAIVCFLSRGEILWREHRTQWVQQRVRQLELGRE